MYLDRSIEMKGNQSMLTCAGHSDVWTSFVGIINQYARRWPQNKCRSLWPIFHGPLILCYISKTIWFMNIILWQYTIGQYDQTFDLKINVHVCHWPIFHVQWFCVISWRQFDLWTSYFGSIGRYDQTFDLKINVHVCHWLIFHGPVILPYIWKTIWWISVYFQIMRQGDQDFDLKMNVGQHGLVILLNIFKIIWWMNMVVGVMDQCDIKIDLIKYI